MGCESFGWKRIIDVMFQVAGNRGAPVLSLKFENSFQQLVFAVLSSRTRDENTWDAVKKLFRDIDGPEDLEKMSVGEIEDRIKKVGFYRVKARRLKKLASAVKEGIPSEINELLELPGVGRKTANLVLAYGFGKPAIAVDTHVHRISNRMSFVDTEKPEQTEKELKKIVGRDLWLRLNKAFVGFGQTVCKPISPLCEECPFTNCCPKKGVSSSGKIRYGKPR